MLSKGVQLYDDTFWFNECWATYHRVMDKIFKNQTSRNLVVYVDDSIVKSKTDKEIVVDLQEIFDNMRKYMMRLNHRKCVFRIKFGKLLGYLVCQMGTDANPKKGQTVIDLEEP